MKLKSLLEYTLPDEQTTEAPQEDFSESLNDLNDNLKSIIFNLHRMHSRGIDISSILDKLHSKSFRNYIINELSRLQKYEEIS